MTKPRLRNTFAEVEEQTNPKTYFEEQILKTERQLFDLKLAIRRTSGFRILVFFATLTGIYFASLTNLFIVAVVGILGFGAFIRLVIVHTRMHQKKLQIEALLKINTRELLLFEKKSWPENQGLEFMDANHPFASDLDVFGQRSLFQLIDRCATYTGRQWLGMRLKQPIKNERQILLRQEAIKELSAKTVWRQNYEAAGVMEQDNPKIIREILEWAQTNDTTFSGVFYKIMLVLNPLLAVFTIIMVGRGNWNESSFILFLAIPFMIIGHKLAHINKQHSQLTKKSDLLNKYAGLLALVEMESFSSELLAENKKSLLESQSAAYHALRKLSALSAAFDYRLNVLVGILLNIFFLWDIIQLIRLEQWKKTYGTSAASWFDQLALFDELSSFAGFAFQHPKSIYPGLSDRDFELVATNMKHPFIAAEKCVGNPIQMNSWKQINIITGANMAGKSTYLRMVGINLLLAMCGAPVMADSFVFKPVDMFTGIKTSDSLQDGESYFFAELKRLKEIIDALEAGQRLFIILDEILRGTNSADKQKGSKGMIQQLIRLGASGIIATHDLSLGELARSFPGHVSNKRFEVEIKQDELVFDYTLKEGISENLNATFLMKKMGIIKSDQPLSDPTL